MTTRETRTANTPRYASIRELLDENDDLITLSDVLPLLDDDVLEGLLGPAELTGLGFYTSNVTCADCDEPIALYAPYTVIDGKPYCDNCADDVETEEEDND